MPADERRGGACGAHDVASLGPALTAEQVRLLRERWITTVEEMVSAAATPDAAAGLAQLLGLEEGGLAAVLDSARRMLGEERFQNLSQRRPGGYMGAILSEEQMRRAAPGKGETV